MEVQGKLKVRDICTLFGIRFEEYVISLNKQVVTPDAEVKNSDELWILPIIEGG